MDIFAFGIGGRALLTGNEALWGYLLLYIVPVILIVSAFAGFAYARGRSKMGQKVSRKQLYLVPAMLVGVAVVLYAVMRFLY